MTSIQDIAKKAGVSISTVSRTLNNYPDVGQKTREKILKIAEEMNYFPNAVARSLVQKKTFTIGMFFGNNMNLGFDHPFFLDVISAVREVVGNAGYDLLVFTNKNKNRSTYTTLCRERSVDGVLMLLTGEGKKKNEQMLELQSSGIPCVAIDIPLVGDKCTYVESDNYTGASDAVKHLVELGHRKIGFIGGDEISKTSYDRMRGYQDTLIEKGVGVRPEYIQLGHFSSEKASKATRKLMKDNPEITAFFVVSDEMACAVMDTLQELGFRVPEDISLVGFDDIKEAVHYSPPLTTIKQMKYEIGSEAAKILLQIINDKSFHPEPKTLPCELVVRKSTAHKVD
ncbi:LacI family DNA-binding transcriptional regulator [Thalassobacillus pellis]|uniref:LacI family DNA-binding transcriptional regulator n=1 Tax=Thalassobacillus pellis TaxID=748008 RepID=UPI001961E056|nr:LacI family DNA-binding transcriptional regulator [Thalassobacillus pellis]MBM7553379.1 DNA-binding LacI/PurR family transcriptional regulator [Thalassobacillus pellis]